ncbi:hypothetical protein HK104_005644, partial [Borealophlyctis nickersoniae]
MTSDYIMIRNAVLQSSPGCKFDVEFDAASFAHGQATKLQGMLQTLQGLMNSTPGFVVDAIFFDHWNQAFSQSKMAVSVVTLFIHDKMGLAIGGNIYGGSTPPYTDYIGLTTTHFQIANP